jgi:hypothetical protein
MARFVDFEPAQSSDYQPRYSRCHYEPFDTQGRDQALFEQWTSRYGRCRVPGCGMDAVDLHARCDDHST